VSPNEQHLAASSIIIMNFFLPNFFDYLQNQPSLNILQQHLEYADVETASISTMLLTILLLLSTVEGVILFFTTLYTWCLFPINLYDGSSDSNGDNSHYHRRRRRRRRADSHGGDHHLFWWLDVEYDSDSESEEDDDDDFDNDDEDDRWTPYRGRQRMDRKDRIQMSLQEHIFQNTQFEDCCAICLVDFKSNDRVVSGTQPCCRSCFHRECLEEWLKVQSSCPCCRKNLLLKSRELLSQKQKEKDEERSRAMNVAPWTAATSNETERDGEQLPAQSDFAESQLTQAATTAPNDIPDWTSDIVPGISPSGSWDQFWFLIF
jgi:Ring finger domain